MDKEELRSLHRQISGNESKILVSIWFLQQDNQKPTPQAIAREAGINRATVYRLIDSLNRRGLLYTRLTAKGENLVRLIMDAYKAAEEKPSPDEVDIRGIIGPSLSEPLSPTQDESQNATDSQNVADKAPQNATTPLVKPSKVEPISIDIGFEPPEPPGGNQFERRARLLQAKALANASIEMLQDHQSLGMHIDVWKEALEIDRQRGNEDVVTALKNLCRELRQRLLSGDRRVGPAWTKASRQIVHAHQTDERKRK